MGEQHIESFWDCEDIESRRDEEQVKLRVYKVELLRDKGYNYCDIVGHEFGHVLGLGEEYYDAKMREQEPDYSHHYSLVRLAFGHRIAEAFTRPEKGQETSSIMSHGKTVRAYHYVTLWEALIRLTEWAGFSPQDWQIVDREE